MRLDPQDTVYVGDSPEDLQWPAAPACAPLSPSSAPFPPKKRLRAAKPDALLESIEELPHALREFY